MNDDKIIKPQFRPQVVETEPEDNTDLAKIVGDAIRDNPSTIAVVYVLVREDGKAAVGYNSKPTLLGIDAILSTSATAVMREALSEC